jgi:hypothetical protein
MKQNNALKNHKLIQQYHANLESQIKGINFVTQCALFLLMYSAKRLMIKNHQPRPFLQVSN